MKVKKQMWRNLKQKFKASGMANIKESRKNIKKWNYQRNDKREHPRTKMHKYSGWKRKLISQHNKQRKN